MILILSFIPNQKISNNLFLKKAKFQRQTLHGSNDDWIKQKIKQCTKYSKYIRLENRRRKPKLVKTSSDIAINFRSSDWEVLGKVMFFAKSLYYVYSLNWYGRKGCSQRKLYFFQIREKRFILLGICGARSKFRTGSLPRIFNYSIEHFNITGNYKSLSFRSLHIKKNAIIFKESKKIPQRDISVPH